VRLLERRSNVVWRAICGAPGNFTSYATVKMGSISKSRREVVMVPDVTLSNHRSRVFPNSETVQSSAGT